MKLKILIILLFCPFALFSQEKSTSIYKELKTFYTDNKEDYTIKTVANKYLEGAFKKEENLKIYKNLNTQTLWYHFSIKPSKKDIKNKYFTISNTYLPFGKIYLVKNNKIDSLHQVSFNKNFPHKNIFYRNPVWKIPLDSILKTDVFLKIKSEVGRTRLVMYLETENEFLKRIETEYFYFGLFISFLISMTLILVFFSVLKKEYAVLFYALYIVTVLFEFLAGKGLGVQYFWSSNSFVIEHIRSFSQSIGVFVKRNLM